MADDFDLALKLLFRAFLKLLRQVDQLQEQLAQANADLAIERDLPHGRVCSRCGRFVETFCCANCGGTLE
ncbi:MAG: hypothetical protein L0Z62_17245 [Gemmataceae bacterium]|nr:hypothetical protein [Gemmataceae bacterium]